MKKKINKNDNIEWCLTSELRNMVDEFKRDELTEADIYNYFSIFLRDAKVDSEIIVNVLENFGTFGEHEALAIKIDEGW